MWTLLEISQMFVNDTMVTVRNTVGTLVFHGSIRDLSNESDLHEEVCFGDIEATFEGAIYVVIYK